MICVTSRVHSTFQLRLNPHDVAVVIASCPVFYVSRGHGYLGAAKARVRAFNVGLHSVALPSLTSLCRITRLAPTRLTEGFVDQYELAFHIAIAAAMKFSGEASVAVCEVHRRARNWRLAMRNVSVSAGN